MSSPLTNLTNAVNETIASEQSAISDIASLTPVTIAVVNESTVLTDVQVQTAMAALQIQVVRDFAPIYGKVAKFIFFSKNSTVPPAYWQMGIVDDSTVADALGWHDITASGEPLSVVAAKTTMDDGLQWSVTLSHEALEMLQDPWIDRCFEVDDGSGNPTQFYSDEVGDPVEDDGDGVTINGVLLSNFVYPSWSRLGSAGPYDFRNLCTAPLELRPGGYTNVLNITAGTGWQQLNARMAPGEPTAPNNRSNRRLELRRKPRSQWVRSIR